MPIPAVLLLLLLVALLGLTLPLALNGDGDSARRFTPSTADHEGSPNPIKPVMPDMGWDFCRVCGCYHPEQASVMSLSFGYEDALSPPSVSQSPPLSSPQSSSPVLFGQSEYMIGDVALAVIFPESDGTVDPNSEDWDDGRISVCMAEITAGLHWWETQEPLANLSFHINSYGTKATSYEPITRSQDEEHLWIAEIMAGLGYNSGTYLDQVAALNDYEMSQQGADWAFTIFVVDSLNDADGRFSDGVYFAYSHVGGPFTVMTYDNGGYGIGNMDWVCAHETGHIFWATDEYDGLTEASGYLNVPDHEGADCIMNERNNRNLCTATRGQIGWKDTDGDHILDPMDTTPDTIFDPAPLDFSSDNVVAYTGQAVEVPLATSNPLSGQDVSINTVTDVQYHVDGGDWQSATAADGVFDNGTEAFTFTTPPLTDGTHLIEARAQNSAGNWATPVQHSVVVDTTNPTVVIVDIADFVSALSLAAGTATDASPGQLDRVEIQIRNISQITYWDGSSWTSVETWITASGTDSWSYALPSLTDGSLYTVSARTIDWVGNVSATASDTFTFDTTIPTVAIDEIPDPVLPAFSGAATDPPPGLLDRVMIQIRNVSEDTYWDEANWVPSPTWLYAAGTDSWSRALPALANGSAYEVKAKAIDKAGNASPEVFDTFTFNDLTTPTVSIISLPDFVNALPAVNGTAEDALPGQLDGVEVKIRNDSQTTYWDGSSWIPDATWLAASGTYAWSYRLPSLTDGSLYTVSARAIDGAGNASPEVSDGFTFDTTIPTITVNDITDPVNSLSLVSGTAGDAPPGQLDRVEIQIRNISHNTYWDGSSWATASAWITASGTDSWSYVMPSLDNGSVYQVRAMAIDRAENPSAVTSGTCTFDATIPTITMNGVSDPLNSLSSMSGTAADAPPGRLDRVEIQIRNVSQSTQWDGSSWVTASAWTTASGTDSWSCALPPLDDGSVYEVRAKAIDWAGNESAAAWGTFTFDTTIPTITIDDVSNLVNSLSSLSGTAADTPPGQPNRVEIQIRNVSQDTYWDGSLWVTTTAWITASGTDPWSYAMPSLNDGSTYEIGAKAIDRAGNESAVAWDSLTFDTTIPTVAMNDVPDSVDSLPTAGGTAADAPPGRLDRVEIQIRNVSQNTYWDGSLWVPTTAWITASGTDPWSYAMPSLNDGSTYEIGAKAIDGAGNESAVAWDNFAVNSHLPLWIWIILGVGAALLAAVLVLVLIPRLASARRARIR